MGGNYRSCVCELRGKIKICRHRQLKGTDKRFVVECRTCLTDFSIKMFTSVNYTNEKDIIHQLRFLGVGNRRISSAINILSKLERLYIRTIKELKDYKRVEIMEWNDLP